MDLEQITGIISARTSGIEVRSKYLSGDLWADGEGWIGPRAAAGGPGPGSPASSFILQEIERAFISQNVLSEVVDRHAAGVIGLAPHVSTVPAEELDEGDTERVTLASMLATFDEDEYLAGGWLAENRVHEALQQAVRAALWAAPVDDAIATAPLRVFIPASELDENGELPLLPFGESLDRVFVHAPKPGSAGLIRDADQQPLMGFYSYTEVVEGDEVAMLELSVLKHAWDTLELELSGDTASIQSADDESTIILQVNVDDEEVTSAVAYDLGGLLTITEITRAPLITEASISLQKLVSLSWTMLGRNTNVAGFLERILMNAMPPGKWVDADGNEVHPGTGGAVFEQGTFSAGPGTATFLSGIPQFDVEGNVTGYSPPSVYDRQPVSPQTLIETKNEARAGILEECAQIHTLIAGDATTSGKSREQALQDFSMSLDVTMPAFRDAANDALTAAVRLAAYFASDGAQYAEAEVHIIPRKNLQVTDEDAAEEMDEAAIIARDNVLAARIANAIELVTKINAQHPGSNLHWAHIIAGRAATSAPAAFLAGALPTEVTSGPE